MAYRKYTGKQITENLGLQKKSIHLFENTDIQDFEPSQRLKLILESSQYINLTTEKAICEYLVAPILGEIKLANKDTIDLFSGEQLNVDKSKDLNGEIDFLFTKTPNFLTIEAPVFCVTEAKIGLIDKAIPQATAQMYGARLFNEKEGKPVKIIYGAVTDGNTWRFLRLEGDILYADLSMIYLNNLSRLLGILQWIVDFYTK